MRDLSSIPVFWARLGLCAALLVLAGAAYSSVLSAEFVNYDDTIYVTKNLALQKGLSWDGIQWAFTTFATANWHPLTWLSLLLDYELFGMDAGGYHATNLGLHLVTTLLLLLWFERVTGSLAKSAFVAGVFALHPTHVESVAWVAERKDVLSGLLWVLTLWAYVWAVRERSATRMALVALLFALGLMAKPMLVTLPLVLLLLDHWPLDRFQTAGKLDLVRVRGAFVEKIPLFGLSIASAGITLQAATQVSMASLRQTPVLERISNALFSYSLYIGKAIWPTDLIPFYAHVPGSVDAATALVSLVGFGLVTGLALYCWRRAPYYTVGWLWFAISLLPVIGLVKVGGQLIADRYTYIPFIGLSVMVAWGAPALLRNGPVQRALLAGAGACALIAMAVVTRSQAELWQNSEILFEHTVAVSPDNPIGHHQIGLVYFEAGRVDEAEVHFRREVEIVPYSWEAQLALGRLLLNHGSLAGAAEHIDLALTYEPTLGGSLARSTTAIQQLAHAGEPGRATQHFSALLVRHPSIYQRADALSPVLLDDGELGARARARVEAKLGLEPELRPARLSLAESLYVQGEARRAIEHYNIALEQKRDLLTLNNMAWILATDSDLAVRDPNRAVSLAEEAVELSGEGPEPGLLDTLATAYENAGRVEAASATRKRADRAAARRAEGTGS